MEVVVNVKHDKKRLKLGDVVITSPNSSSVYIVMKDYEECMKHGIVSDNPNPYVALRELDGTHGMAGTKLLREFETYINEHGYKHYPKDEYMFKLVSKEGNN